MKIRITSVVPDTEWPVVKRLYPDDVEVTDIEGEGRPAKLVVEIVEVSDPPVMRSTGAVLRLSKIVERTGYEVQSEVRSK